MPDGTGRKRGIKDGLTALQSDLKGKQLQTHGNGDASMNKRVLTFIFILFLLPSLVTGCNNELSPDQNNNAPTSTLVPLSVNTATSSVTEITATTPANLTNIIRTTTALPSGKLQLTFIEWKDDLTEFYGMDVDCVEIERLCLGEPTLLLLMNKQ
jgi:hypothetical protein